MAIIGPRIAACFLLCNLVAAPGVADVLTGNPSNYLTRLDELRPGDTLELQPGTYTEGLPIYGMNGAPDAWITIRGPADKSAVFPARLCCNTVEIRDSAYVEIASLTLDGQNMDGPFGVNSSRPSHHITLSDLLIRDFDGHQQTVGISTKASAWNWTIRRCRIERAGTGMYLGSSDGSAPFVAGLIENNVFVDTIGYNMQIKHQNPRPTDLGLPTQTSRTIIRDNVFSKGSNSSGGGLARPNLLLGHMPLSGPGQDDYFEVYRNFFYQNPTEALFQGEGNLAIYGNLFVNDAGSAINIQAHNHVPRQVEVFNNTIVASGSGIRISGADPAYDQRVRGNASFAGTPIAGGDSSGNVTAAYSAADTYLNNPFGALGQLDLYPRPGQLVDSPLATDGLNAYSDWNRDFNGQTRDFAYRGAYSGEGTNPGWTPALQFKGSAGGPPPPSVSLSAAPSAVAEGASAELQWTASEADNCTASGGWDGARATSGSETVGPLLADTDFTLSCSNAAGSTQRTVTVEVVGPPSVELTASPLSVVPGGSAVLAWSSADAGSCSASGGWSGSRNAGGSESVGPIAEDTTFSLTCSGAGGSATDSVTITADGDPGDSVVLLFEDFEAYPAGGDPAGWLDTGANNSLSEDPQRFAIAELAGNKAFATGDTQTTNIHSHFDAQGSFGWSNYEFIGRVQTSTAGDSIGVTLLSDYPNSDAYYRLRSWNGGSFELSTHGNGLECSGDSDTGILPTPGEWYWFRVQAEDNGTATELRARVWPEGAAEPTSWQAACADSGTRRTTGTVGLWAVVAGDDGGTKYWDNLHVETLAAGGPAPALSLSAAPGEVGLSGSSTLSWTGSNVDACSASGGWSGDKPTDGSETVGPLTETADYSLTCSSPGGNSIAKTVTITVQPATAPAPTLDLSATPATVSADGFSTLDWTSSAADSCTASGAWNGPRPLIGSESVGPLNQAASFALSCSGAGGSVSRSVTVNVTSPPGEEPEPPAVGAIGSEPGGGGASGWLELGLLSAMARITRRRRLVNDGDS